MLQDWSPVQTFELLGGATPSGVKRMSSGAAIHPQPMRGWTDQDQWDAVAYLWSLGTTPDQVDVGRRLFSRNCAACHGERGSGDGPGGKSQPNWPADFTNARTMLAGTGSLYTAKIRCGGMGSGMPYWGNIFTQEELGCPRGLPLDVFPEWPGLRRGPAVNWSIRQHPPRAVSNRQVDRLTDRQFFTGPAGRPRRRPCRS